jgi:hypothetical protein
LALGGLAEVHRGSAPTSSGLSALAVIMRAPSGLNVAAVTLA